MASNLQESRNKCYWSSSRYTHTHNTNNLWHLPFVCVLDCEIPLRLMTATLHRDAGTALKQDLKHEAHITLRNDRFGVSWKLMRGPIGKNHNHRSGGVKTCHRVCRTGRMAAHKESCLYYNKPISNYSGSGGRSSLLATHIPSVIYIKTLIFICIACFILQSTSW